MVRVHKPRVFGGAPHDLTFPVKYNEIISQIIGLWPLEGPKKQQEIVEIVRGKNSSVISNLTMNVFLIAFVVQTWDSFEQARKSLFRNF